MKSVRCGNNRVDPTNTEQLNQTLGARGLKYSQGSHPKADPQTLANIEHLNSVLKKQGPDAAVEEFRRMFGPDGTLPPVEARHRAKAAAYRRWNNLPPLSETHPQRSDSKTEALATKQ